MTPASMSARTTIYVRLSERAMRYIEAITLARTTVADRPTMNANDAIAASPNGSWKRRGINTPSRNVTKITTSITLYPDNTTIWMMPVSRNVSSRSSPSARFTPSNSPSLKPTCGSGISPSIVSINECFSDNSPPMTGCPAS